MGKSAKAPETSDLPTEDDYSTAREQQPVQWSRGRRQLTVQWMSDALDLQSQQAPDDANGKK